MIIAVASQNRREVTGHLGVCRRFWLYEVNAEEVLHKQLLGLPRGPTFHEHRMRAIPWTGWGQ